MASGTRHFDDDEAASLNNMKFEEQRQAIRIGELIRKVRAVSATPEELEELDAWLKISEQNRAFYRTMISDT